MDDTNKTTQPVNTPDTGNVEDKNGGKTFTQEDLDKVVAKRVNEIETKWETKVKDIVAKERSEAERLAKLSAEEKEKEERTKKDAEIRERENALTLREMKIEAKSMLQEKGIPVDLVDFVVDLDANKTKENIEKLAKTYSKAVENGVTDKLKGTPPEDFSNSTNQNDSGKKQTPFAF